MKKGRAVKRRKNDKAEGKRTNSVQKKKKVQGEKERVKKGGGEERTVAVPLRKAFSRCQQV